jgi:hypothetical protein
MVNLFLVLAVLGSRLARGHCGLLDLYLIHTVALDDAGATRAWPVGVIEG